MSAEQPSPAERMSFFDHLGELRRRIAYSVLALIIGTLACWALREFLFDWIRQPLANVPNHELQAISLLEMFTTYLKLSITAAVFLTSPFILWQAWAFIGPGLYSQERRWGAAFVVLGALFFVGGGAFGYYVVLPMTFDYLAGMAHTEVKNQFSVALYFSIVLKLLLAFGLVFETPLVMWVLAAAGLVKPDSMRRARKYWVVVAVLLGAMLTDPSPLTQLLMAGPLIVFFELGIIGAYIVAPKRNKQPLPSP